MVLEAPRAPGDPFLELQEKGAGAARLSWTLRGAHKWVRPGSHARFCKLAGLGDSFLERPGCLGRFWELPGLRATRFLPNFSSVHGKLVNSMYPPSARFATVGYCSLRIRIEEWKKGGGPTKKTCFLILGPLESQATTQIQHFGRCYKNPS